MNESLFYNRQLNLKEVGKNGQLKLKNSRVLIVGAGGLGHPSAMYLAAAGIGTLGILDFDKIEASNLNRQIAFKEKDIGSYKANILSKYLKEQNPFIEITSLCKKIDASNIEATLSSYDIVLDCSDNLETKFLLHDFCWLLKKDLFQASIYQYEGQIQSFYYQNNRDLGCLRCLWENIPKEKMKNCQEAGIIGSVAGVLGTLQANETIKSILGLGNKVENKTKIVNLLDLDIQTIKWKKKINCNLCSSEKSSLEIIDLNRLNLEDFEVSKLVDPKMILVDIREKSEIQKSAHSFSEKVIELPNSEFSSWSHQIDPQKQYLFFCQKGHRSFDLVKILRKQKGENCFSLHGGLDSVSS